MSTLSSPSGTKTCTQCAEEIKSQAQVCRYCGAHYAVSTTGYCSTCHSRQATQDGTGCAVCGGALVDLAVESRYAETPPAPAAAPAPTPAAAPAPASAPASAPKGLKGLSLGRRLVVALALVGLAFLGVAFVFSRLNAEAQDPQEIVDRFDEAGIECVEQEAGTDFGDTKSIWCGTAAGKSLLVMTSGDDVDIASWLSSQCAVLDDNPLLPQSGAVVYGDSWTIDVQRLVNQGESAKATATRLAEVLDGQVRTYDCQGG